MDNITRWCIIGAGGIADRRTIPALLKDSTNVIVALMDKVPSVAEKLGAKYNVPYYSDEEEMLKNSKCDAVYIATPVMCHDRQARLALKYNLPVFVEKPLGYDYNQAKALLDDFKAKGLQLTVGYMMKYHNLHHKAKLLVKNGGIGQVSSMRLQFTCWYPDIEGAWRQNKALGGGGAIMDLGVHCIELAEYILNDEIVDVKSIYQTRTFKYEVEDSGILVFKTKGGVLGHIDVNFNIPDACSNSRLEIYGTEGYIECRGTLAQDEVGTMDYLYAPQGDYNAQQNRKVLKPKRYKGKGSDLYLAQLQDFCKVLHKGKADYRNSNRAVHVQEIVDKAYKQN